MYERSSDAAARAGIDRRRFLQGAGGMARQPRRAQRLLIGRRRRGAFDVVGLGPAVDQRLRRARRPRRSPTCERTLGDRGEFIFDIHTHHVMPGPARGGRTSPRIARHDPTASCPSGCTEADPIGLPRPGRLRARPVPGQRHDGRAAVRRAQLGRRRRAGAVSTKRSARSRLGRCRWPRAASRRVLVHDVIAPNFGTARRRGSTTWRPRAATGRCRRVQGVHGVGPGAAGLRARRPGHRHPGRRAGPRARGEGDLRAQGPAAPRVRPALQRPRGHGPAGRRGTPTWSFVVYHGAFERETVRGPLRPGPRPTSAINTLIRAMDDDGVAAERQRLGRARHHLAGGA